MPGPIPIRLQHTHTPMCPARLLPRPRARPAQAAAAGYNTALLSRHTIHPHLSAGRAVLCG
jgi:hypothetical protein